MKKIILFFIFGGSWGGLTSNPGERGIQLNAWLMETYHFGKYHFGIYFDCLPHTAQHPNTFPQSLLHGIPKLSLLGLDNTPMHSPPPPLLPSTLTLSLESPPWYPWVSPPWYRPVLSLIPIAPHLAPAPLLWPPSPHWTSSLPTHWNI